jgi:hypothetical protein
VTGRPTRSVTSWRPCMTPGWSEGGKAVWTPARSSRGASLRSSSTDFHDHRSVRVTRPRFVNHVRRMVGHEMGTKPYVVRPISAKPDHAHMA